MSAIVQPLVAADPDSLVDAVLADDPGQSIAHYAALPGTPSRVTITRAVRNGDLPAVLIGRTYYIHPEAFADWIAARRVPSRDPLTPDLREWAREVAATAPPLNPVTARAVVDVLLEVQRDHG